MSQEIISYHEMCRREGRVFQRGMNFRLRDGYSVILMSTRKNARYQDRVQRHGAFLEYQGHDVHRSPSVPEPAQVDQPEFTARGFLTENGKFYNAALEFKYGIILPERVKVYQKIHSGIWCFNGWYYLIEGRKVRKKRQVFMFTLQAMFQTQNTDPEQELRSRTIPVAVKLKVWQRDQGRCVLCGAQDNLHFDHIIPYSMGGSSHTAENIQLLCARHNLMKSDSLAEPRVAAS